jgi:tetratricopeptide (TPR) repeat protein
VGKGTMQSRFSSHTLAEIFRDLYLGECSGVLHLTRGDVSKKIYFDRGMILFAESPLSDEDLGPRLVHEGKISSGALAEARRNISEPKDLAQALVNRGLIGKEALRHTVRYIVDRTVRSVFQWEGGNAKFNEGWLLQEIFEGDVVSTFEFLLRGISSMVGFEPIRDALKGMSNRIRFRQPTPLPLERLALSPTHGFILSQVDGATSVSDALAIMQPDDEDLACRFLYGLLVMGVIEFDPCVAEGPFKIATILRDHADTVALEAHQVKMISQAYQQMQGQNAYQLLAVPTTANREEIERAYEDAKEAFGRDRILPRVRDKLRTELSVVESRLVEAYLTLIQAEAPVMQAQEVAVQRGDGVRADDLLMRVELDKTKTKRAIEEAGRVAEAYYAKAMKYMREGDYHNAIQYGKLAISYNEDDARYYFMLADCQSRNPEARWQRMAEQNFLKATQLDSWNPDYLISLGRFYKKRGLKLRARKQFEQALKIAPSHDVATKELEGLK